MKLAADFLEPMRHAGGDNDDVALRKRARLATVEYEKATTLDKRNRTASAKLKQIREMPAN